MIDIIIDDEGIPCISLDDFIEDRAEEMAQDFRFSILMSKKNENLSDVLKDLKEFIDNSGFNL